MLLILQCQTIKNIAGQQNEFQNVSCILKISPVFTRWYRVQRAKVFDSPQNPCIKQNLKQTATKQKKPWCPHTAQKNFQTSGDLHNQFSQFSRKL